MDGLEACEYRTTTVVGFATWVRALRSRSAGPEGARVRAVLRTSGGPVVGRDRAAFWAAVLLGDGELGQGIDPSASALERRQSAAACHRVQTSCSVADAAEVSERSFGLATAVTARILTWVVVGSTRSQSSGSDRLVCERTRTGFAPIRLVNRQWRAENAGRRPRKQGQCRRSRASVARSGA